MLMKIILISTVFFVFALTGCGSRSTVDLANVEANAAEKSATAPTPTPSMLTSQAVLDAFKNAQIPITDVVVYDEKTDPNNLLGRPNQYVGKINFTDSRAKGLKKQDCTIEVFDNEDALNARKTYTEGISKASSMFAQYIYSHKNVLVRLNHQVLPKDAAQYETVLKGL